MSNPVWSEPATLASLLRSRAAERGEQTAFVFLADGEAEGERLTYAGLDARARAIAAALRESLEPGDRALLLYPPGLEFIAAFFGCLYAGGIAVPAYPPRLKDRSQGRLRSIARDAEPKAALTTGTILEAFATPPNIALVPELATARWIATDELPGSDAELPDPDPESVAFLQYTSGSTAAPKGVMVTHANLLHNERMIGSAFALDARSVVVGWLPLYHDMGLIGNVLQPLHAGGTCVLMAPVAFLQKPLRWLEAIDRYRGTTSGGPNFAYELCLRRIGEDQKAGLDLSSWRLAYNGAEPVRAETLERFAAAFAPCGFRREAFYPCYGLAEATLFVSGGAAGTVPQLAEVEERSVVSCGHAWEGQRIAIVDPETGEEVAAGAVGEVWVSGPSVAHGYWRNPEATANDFEAKLGTGEGPFLRTGDLGFLRGGELYVTGRIKDLIIIRGRNHYPQDVELTAERSHPDLRPGSGAAFSVEVAGEERLVLVQEVERRRRDGFEEVVEAVRRAVAEAHEVQVHDVVLVRVGTVPKTSSGKIQRRATRSLYLENALEVVGRSMVASETSPDVSIALSRDFLAALEPTEHRAAVERFLRERAAAAVGVPAAAIDPERALTAYGLDSLAAIELKGVVESALGVGLPLAEILEGAGTARLAELLARTDTDEHGSAWTDMPGPWPDSLLSHGERALWFIDRLAPEGGAYNIAVAAHARGLDPAALQQALTVLALRHPALRSVFPALADEPVRQVLDHPEVDFVVEDAAGWSEARLAGRLAEEAYRPFDLGQGPLLRVRAFERGDGEYALLLSVHHIAVDFASLAVVARDLARLLAGAELEPLPFGVSDFVRWQGEMLAGPRGERLWDYWREALAGLPDLDLPADRPRPPMQTYGGGARTLELPPDLAVGVRSLASRQGTTLFTALLAVFHAQLARYSGQENFAVGSPAAGRPPELAGTVGYFVNPVALRADLTGNPSFAEFLDRTRRTVLASLEHGDFPFALLAERLRPARDPARTPLFQVMFLLQRPRPGEASGIATFALGESGGRIDLGSLELESLRLEERRAQFDLTLRAAEEAGGRLRASLEFNTDLFDAETAERMLGHFRTLLAGAVEHPDRPVVHLPLLAPVEREQVLVTWNATAAEHREDVLLHGLFEEQVARTPDAEALVAGPERLTYAELSHRADELGRRLRSLGVGPETRVGVKLGRSADLVVSLLGVLKAGGAYVPLDPKYPEERLALMREDSGAALVIDESWDWSVKNATEDVRRAHPTPGNLAYLIYTSGSTGRPKAVAIEHRSAALMVQWSRGVFSPEELAGVLASTSVAFDLSVFEIFVPLSLGGRIILAENALELPHLAAAGEVTLVNTVPSALAELVRGDGLPSSVRTVNLAGEPIPPALADAVHGLPGEARLYNLYGPSEDTTYSTWTRIAPGADVTIGGPIDGTRAYVLDAHGEPLPVGVPGELFLGGGGLARGYLGRPELTAERFVPDPFGPSGERLYRTGDLVRRRADGDLDFLGRIDHQVKIRGFRVELGEVEAAFSAHPAVREAVVLALPELLPEPESGRRLAAFLVLKEEVEPGALRSWLHERLPDAFVPTAWKMLPALPLSPNGKVDRRALAAMSPEAEAVAGSGAEPRTPVERALAELVAAALGLESIGLHDDFFALGGHSLLAARVVSQASRLFGVDLPVSVLFQAPTVGALAGRIAAAAGGADAAAPVVPVLRPHEGREDLPLSFAQQRLWFLDRLQPGGAAYNMPGAAELEGALDVDALAAALAEVVRRHEALRTRFVIHGGEPVQVVDPPFETVLEVVDLAGLPEPEREAEARMRAEAAAPFDLSRGPLFRATLLRLGPHRYRLLLTLHHMVADGWSLGVLLGELAALYGRTGSLRHPSVQYADWVVWQRHWLAGEALDRQLAWWKDELAGAPTMMELPADRPRPAMRTQRGGVVRTTLPSALADGVRFLARRRGATPFMALLAAFQTFLLRMTGQDDLLVGSAVAGRTRPEIEGLIGFFANTLVLRGELAGDPSFLDALEQARRRTAGAWAHQDLPVERLVEELQPGRELGLTPLFQVVFVLQSAPVELALPGLAVRRLPVASGTAKFDLTLEMTEQEDGLAAAWELSRDLFDETTIERMAGWFARLLAGVVEAPERRLSDLSLLGEAELRQLLVDQNSAPTKAPLDVPVHRLFEEQAARGPQRIALVLGDRELSYGELNERADRLAQRLAAEGVVPETLVGVLLERSFEMIEAFLAILKAGGAYVPLDPSWPDERLNDLVHEAGIRLVVTSPNVETPRGASPAAASFVLRHPRSAAGTPWERDAPRGVSTVRGTSPGRLAYAMFTSGSTGRPKTVGIEHGSIVRLVRDTDFADFGPDHVFLQLAAPAFDAATLEIWGALLHGARLVLYPASTPSLDELGEVLTGHGVTTLWLTAGLFHQVVESRIGILRGLRQLLAGGDVLAPAAVDRVLAELPGTRLINGYGPTENTTFTCCHTVAAPVPPGRTVPIGRPIAGTEVYVVDRTLRPVPVLVPGELVAGGAGLARGYLGRPDLTAERFVPNPFDGARLYRTGDLVRWRPSGEIEFLGRIDRQVKIRGFRVEPGEVEAVLAGHPAVAQAAVLVREVEPGDRRLVAFVVFHEESDLRSWLGEQLPAYLIPAIVALPELPLTANGKVDRRALERIAPELASGTPERTALDTPRTSVEELIAGIWAEVLGVERVGIHDDFFELGGHSLLATRVVSRIVDTLQVNLPLSTFFEAPTVAGLGERLFGVASSTLTRSLAFWRWRLAGLEPVELPADGPRTPAATAPARTCPLDLPDALAARVAATAREAGVTPFMVLLAGVYTLLARLTGQLDLTVGAPIATRYVTNTLPLRVGLDGDPSFRELLGRVRTAVLEAYAHGDVPFERLVEELQPARAPGRHPLFDVLLTDPSTPLMPVEAQGAEARLDLTFTIHECDGVLSGLVEGRGDLFEEATLGRIADGFGILLAGALADLGARLSALPLLHELLEERVRKAPDATDPQLKVRAFRIEAGEAAPPPVRRVHPGAEAPLSFAQQRLWFLHQLEPDSPAYHVSGALRLTGPLRAGWLERALGEIVRRHEALRTVFLETEAGPVQRVLPDLSLRIPVVDLCGLPGREDEAERLGLAEARRLFDLTAGPVLRAQLLRLDEEEHLLVVVLHHIASDGWSLGVMIGELAAIYTAFATDEPSPLPELAIQYADFAEWQRRTLRGRYLERQIGWWRAQLADPPVLDLPADRPRPPVPSGRGRNLPVALPGNLTDGLQALARREGVTLYMVLLAAYATLLGRWSGQDDLTVGSPIANRDRQEIEPLIGCFVNTLTLRVRLAGDPGFRELLARLREVTLGAYDHQGVPFERLVEELAPERDRAHAPLFQVMLVLQNAPLPPLRVGPLVLERRELPTGTAKFDLTLALAEEAGGIAGALEHSADLFETATAARLMGHLAELLRGAVDDPGRALSGLPLLTAGERGQILGTWNDTAAVFESEGEGEGSETLLLSDLVAAQAARTPGAEAVAGWRLRGEERLTYAELLDRADRLAGHLAALGVGPEARVGVCIDRTADLPVVLLAVLRAGGAYVPLDPAYPRERLEFMLRDSGADVLVTQSDLAGRCGPFAGATVWLDQMDLSEPVGTRHALPGNLAYLIYTSGSTGFPKAVAVEHRSAVAMVQWALGAFSPEELVGVLFSTSVCFDLSVFELFVPLAAGGKVLIAANALELPSLPYAGEVTMVNTVPSAMTELVRGEGFPASVRAVNLAGEPLKGSLVDAVYELPGVRRVVNLYGPSEDTTYSTWETIPPSSERMGEPLIGRPVANTRVYLLDRSGHLVPEGVPGELLLAGAGLARGYLGRPDLTAERFVPDPFGMPASRLYRTGDLARWRPGGRLEYLGRIDHQVKVRGFRIELGEIEAALVRHPAVGDAAVLARDDEGRGKILVAFLVRREGMEGADLRPLALRQLLRRSLPEHMVPGAWVELPALPLTPNGKVDRRTLGRLRFEAGTGRQGTVAPRTPTEELLAALWCEVLGRDRVGVHDSFFELGGHSLLATRLVSRVRATFGRELPLARLFESPTIAELSRLLDEARGGVARSAPILPAPRQGDLPLSFAQERLWFLDRIQPGAAYNVPLALRLRGTLDAGRLGAAFGAIVARHEALRTVFVESDGEPAQRILPVAPAEAWPLPVVDLSSSAGELPGLAEADALRPFDLASGPLLRTTLLRLGAADHVLLLNMHHIVSDGWSLGVLLRELTAFYGGDPVSLPELPVQYADFAVWQKDWLRGQELERQMSYWRRQLAGAPAVLDLPLDRPRPLMATTNGAERPVVLSPALTGDLTALARRQGATTFMLLLAAWVTLLHRISNQADLNVGTPIAGRNRAETEGLVGFFVNTLVMRADLNREGVGDPAFPDLLAQIRGTALAAYDHQDLPFEKLVDELRPQRDMSHQPLFQVMFALQNAPLGALELPGLTLEPTELGATVAKFELTLSLMERNGSLTGALEYNTGLFDAATAARLAGHLGVLLEEIARSPERCIAELPLLTPEEAHQLLVEWAQIRQNPLAVCLHEIVEHQTDSLPEATAVEHEEVAWSYRDLDLRANQLAWTLRGLGIGPEVRVALVVERTADMIVAMLGVLKAGGAYVPLDPAHPRERLAFLLEDSGARVLLTQERLLAGLPETSAHILCLDRDREEIARRPEHRPESGVTSQSPAYMIYTSGSTGSPKGVLVPHHAVVTYIRACADVYGNGPGDRTLQFASISFDPSVEEIFCTLSRGATLVIRGEVQEGIAEFVERLRTRRITQLEVPTAFWHQMAAGMETESLSMPPDLRVLFAGGERMLARRLASWWRLVGPGFRLINAYGPTEATIAATLCLFPGEVAVDAGLREVPIGRPLPHVRAYVLDRWLRPVPIGVVGELCLGGLSLARGYLDRPDLTAARFIPNPFAHLEGEPGERLYHTGDLVRLLPGGLLEFVGRTDHQVKLRGYRIELGEIESVLAAHPALQEVAVVTRREASEDVQLVAYAEAKGEVAAPSPAELRMWLEERLPSYMVPAALQILPALPINAHGKVDRQALERYAPQAKERTALTAPRNELEEAIATVWRDVFGLDDPDGLGIHDNFFDAGGSSLLLVKLHSRLQTALGRKFPLVEMFKHPTIAALAASLGAEAPAPPSLDKARARTDTRRTSMRQMQQLREQRRRGS